MRIIFFGTPEFAVPSLRALLGAGHEVVAVVTQPDRSHGRSRSVVVAPPVKVAALAAGLPVLQPDKPVGAQFIDQLTAFGADLGVVVAYGHILRPQVLAIPRLGMINVHASLLPRWRGAAPIQWAIRSGDRTTGVTIMQMEAGLDSGPVWHARGHSHRPRRDRRHPDRAAERPGRGGTARGASAVRQRSPSQWRRTTGARHARAQDRPRHCRASTGTSAPRQLAHHVAAFDPVPGAWTTLAGVDVKLFGARAQGAEGAEAEDARCGAPGGRRARDRAPATASSLVREVQPAGKKRQPVAEWVRGRGIAVGARFT